ELEDKISKIDVTVSMVQNENKEVKETIEKIDQSVLDLLSLYEIVSNQVNPFVGEEEESKEILERFDTNEEHIYELSKSMKMLRNEIENVEQKTAASGVSPETGKHIETINNKLETFADALVDTNERMQGISQAVNSFSQRADVLEGRMEDLTITNGETAERINSLENGTAIQTNQHSTKKANPDRDTAENDYDEEFAGKLPLLDLDIVKKKPTNIIVLLNWIEFLMERVGRNNLMDVLDYYVDIGWISEGVRSEIMAYARGIDYYVEKPTWRLLPEDHTKSLLFIEKLRGRKIDRNMLSTIDREMAKVKHGLEELYGI
ncbi:FlaD/FlaE family flagellar protein, partial [Methanohalophilus halophilus]